MGKFEKLEIFQGSNEKVEKEYNMFMSKNKGKIEVSQINTDNNGGSASKIYLFYSEIEK